MQYMKDTYQFNPSKRAFQTQFKKWEFPSKQNPAHRNVDLVTRVKDLWEQNYSQRDMVRTLNEEGFQIKERELMRVRAKHRWLLRIPNGQKATPEEAALQAELLAAGHEDVKEELPEEVAQKRKERHDKMQQESDERWASKKRRRRTRDYAGIPADPPGPPRFPSETTLGESMEYLAMSGDLYKQARADFQRICEEMSIIKKTLAGTDKWASAKNRLIIENAHLAAVFADPEHSKAKDLALDVICTDVTKRMRTMDTRMTIVDAKNILGINPEESRQIRNSFYTILQADHFTSKLETGPEHWDELKQQWIMATPMLMGIMTEDQDQQILGKKKKALEVLCRDVMKRLRDAQKKGDGTQPVATTPKSVPVRKREAPTPPQPLPETDEQSAASASLAAATAAAAVAAPPLPPLDMGDLQIDPSLLAEAPLQMNPIAVYIKPHPESTVHAKDKMFLATLSTRSYSEIEEVVINKWPDVAVSKIEGMARAANGGEVPFAIEGDDELDAYLEYVQGSKVVFLVQVNKAQKASDQHHVRVSDQTLVSEHPEFSYDPAFDLYHLMSYQGYGPRLNMFG